MNPKLGMPRLFDGGGRTSKSEGRAEDDPVHLLFGVRGCRREEASDEEPTPKKTHRLITTGIDGGTSVGTPWCDGDTAAGVRVDPESRGTRGDRHAIAGVQLLPEGILNVPRAVSTGRQEERQAYECVALSFLRVSCR